MRLFRVLTLLFAAGALSVLTAGCGGGDAKDGGKKSGDKGKKSGKKSSGKKASGKKKTAKSSKPGGSTPEDVVKKMQAAVKSKDFAAVVNLMEPTERKGTAAMFALMPQLLRMMKPMLAAMGGMAGGMAGAMGGGEDAEKAKAEAKKKAEEMMAGMDKLIVEMDGVIKKHKVDIGSMEELGVNMMGGSPDPMDLAKKVGTKLDKVDLGAFMADMISSVEKMMDIMPGPGGPGSKQKGPWEDIAAKVGDGNLKGLKIDGDKATGKLNDETVRFVKVDGRWYAKDAAAMGNDKGGDDEDMGDDDEDWEEEDDDGMGGG